MFTMRQSILAMSVAAATLLAFSPANFAQNAGVTVKADAPERHVVVPGDTLWSIASKFLKDPHRWPDVWGMNKDTVKNPHRIYPGNVIVLDRSGSEPRLRMATVKVQPRIRDSKDSLEISSIPASVIEPFLSQPLVVQDGELASAPKIVAAQEGRVYMGTGDLAYVEGDTPENVARWNVFRPGKALVDPETKATLGYEAVFVGSAKMERKTSPTTFRIVDSKQEVGNGDRLLPAPRPQIVNYVPRPAGNIDARVMSVYGGVNEAGTNQIITISRGKADGVELGHVVALWSYGQTVKEGAQVFERGTREIKLPDERNGLAFVFRTFDKVSYALVMSSVQPIKIGDVAKKP